MVMPAICRSALSARPRVPGFLLAILVLLAGCGRVDSIRDALDPPSAHERYAESLRSADLAATALGSAWLGAADRALASPLSVTLPFRETAYFPSEDATAAGYRFSVPQGQRLVITLESDAAGTATLFADLFEIGEEGDPAEHVESIEAGETGLTVEPDEDRTYLLRLQPELLRSGRFTVTIRTTASLAFPVAGRDSRAIQSRFGAPRDGGARDHHGIDIFAQRGTPVVAAATGTVGRVGTTRLGGNVVWLRDAERGQSLYYAHLDSQAVTGGERVISGDTLGFVGNTGNARTTPPHLHFGIYRRGKGPLDPYAFVFEPPDDPPEVTADTSELGEWWRVAQSEARLRIAPDANAPTVDTLPQHTALRVLGASRSWYRVRLPDGASGYIIASALEDAATPVRRERVSEPGLVLDRPGDGAPVVDSVASGATVPVLGLFAGYALVTADSGRTRWVGLE